MRPIDTFNRRKRIARGTYCPFHCGDLVIDEVDERHIGRVCEIVGNDARIQWVEHPNMYSIVPWRKLRHAVTENDLHNIIKGKP